MNLLQPVKVAVPPGADDARDGVEREIGVAGKVVVRENVVVEHGETEHGVRRGALLHRRRTEKRKQSPMGHNESMPS